MPEDFDGWAAVDEAYSRKMHYFVAGRSLCRTFGFIRGLCCALDSWPDDHKDNCATCRKKLAKSREKEGELHG